MEYLTVKEAGEKWSLTGRMVKNYCTAGRIKGVVKKGNLKRIMAQNVSEVIGAL